MYLKEPVFQLQYMWPISVLQSEKCLKLSGESYSKKNPLSSALGILAVFIYVCTQQAKTGPQLSTSALKIVERSYSTSVTCLQNLLCVNQGMALSC